MNEAKSTVSLFLQTFSTGDVDAIMSMLTDDATWWVSGRIAGMSGTNSKEELESLLRQVNPLYRDHALPITPSSMIAEGNIVAVEAESNAELKNGRSYNNLYHFLFETTGGKIRRIREYSDTHHMLETFTD